LEELILDGELVSSSIDLIVDLVCRIVGLTLSAYCMCESMSSDAKEIDGESSQLILTVAFILLKPKPDE
jgi:hypothetical protein